MKKLILLSFLLLNGCALIMSKFDNVEYQYITHIRTIAQTKNCDSYIIENLRAYAAELKNYSQYIPHNEAQIKLNDDLFTLIDELSKKENPSPAYCSAKMTIIEKSAERIQQVTGSKPR
jgi:hypothetical protein